MCGYHDLPGYSQGGEGGGFTERERACHLGPWGAGAYRGADGKGHGASALLDSADEQGYFVVGIDARPGPLELCRGFRLAPDVLIDASKTSAEDAQREINEVWAKKGGEERPLGVDGASPNLATTEEHG